MNTQPLQEYISRLSGRPVAVDEIVSLSSAQQAAVRSWLRNNKDFGVPAQVKSRVSVRMLVNAQEPAGDGAAAPLMETPISIPPVERGGAIAAVGVDIEHVSVLPEAEDYRIHPFFTENFSKTEIVHCIGSDNPGFPSLDYGRPRKRSPRRAASILAWAPSRASKLAMTRAGGPCAGSDRFRSLMRGRSRSPSASRAMRLFRKRRVAI